MRTLQQIDADIQKMRARILDLVPESAEWDKAWEQVDRLLEERVKVIKEGGSR